jgi:hypothetical protein
MKLKIVQCKDSMMWYAKRVGEEVEFVREDKEYYWSREPAGHTNIVHKQDAVIVYEDRYEKAIADVKSANLSALVFTTYDHSTVEGVRQRIINHLEFCQYEEQS